MGLGNQAQEGAAVTTNYRNSGPIKCKIWWDTTISAYHISVPYNDQFRETLKRLIPASHRDFDEDAKIWIVAEEFLKPIVSLANAVWPQAGSVSVVDRAMAEATSSSTSSTAVSGGLPSMCEQFMALLDPGEAQELYRKASLRLHPDRGGDMEKMTQLNTLWGRIKKEIYKL